MIGSQGAVNQNEICQRSNTLEMSGFQRTFFLIGMNVYFHSDFYGHWTSVVNVHFKQVKLPEAVDIVM